jgi:hypothetical protein
MIAKMLRVGIAATSGAGTFFVGDYADETTWSGGRTSAHTTID